mmetsp:Transcript_6756/g.10544  ORF Transcript_6756/g.10544 Transcript_6756/m.10544 type:complete len:84 (+) Transcript_6756:629-880(+)
MQHKLQHTLEMTSSSLRPKFYRGAPLSLLKSITKPVSSFVFSFTYSRKDKNPERQWLAAFCFQQLVGSPYPHTPSPPNDEENE